MATPDHIRRLPHSHRARARAIVLLAGVCFLAGAPAAQAITTPTIVSPQSSSQQSAGSESSGSTLESAAAKAGSTGRTVAMSLIGLAFAVAAIVLAFKRDFKEAAGVFAVGIVCVLLATSTGVSVLQETVNSLFGSH
jgi:glucose uptake protein GlcU